MYLDKEAPISLVFGVSRRWDFYPRYTLDEFLTFSPENSQYGLSVDDYPLGWDETAACPMKLGEWGPRTGMDGYQRTITECMDGVPPTQKPTLEEVFDQSQCCKRIKVTQFFEAGSQWNKEGICSHTETFDPSLFLFDHDPWTTPKYGYDCEGFEGQSQSLWPLAITWRDLSITGQIMWALDQKRTAAEQIACSVEEINTDKCRSQMLAHEASFVEGENGQWHLAEPIDSLAPCPIIPQSGVVWNPVNAFSGE